MEKRDNKYGLRLLLREYTHDEELVSIDLFDYFELIESEEILEVIRLFTLDLKLYLEKHDIIQKEV